jgi:hypothetical protein
MLTERCRLIFKYRGRQQHAKTRELSRANTRSPPPDRVLRGICRRAGNPAWVLGVHAPAEKISQLHVPGHTGLRAHRIAPPRHAEMVLTCTYVRQDNPRQDLSASGQTYGAPAVESAALHSPRSNRTAPRRVRVRQGAVCCPGYSPYSMSGSCWSACALCSFQSMTSRSLRPSSPMSTGCQSP